MYVKCNDCGKKSRERTLNSIEQQRSYKDGKCTSVFVHFPYEFAPCTMKEQGGVRNDRLYWKL